MENGNKGVKRKEWLTFEIAEKYREKANMLPDNGRQDVGARRELRLELQQLCGLEEIEAINVLNGNHVAHYVNKYYMLKNNIRLEKDPKKNKNLINLEALEELERLKMLVRNDFDIID